LRHPVTQEGKDKVFTFVENLQNCFKFLPKVKVLKIYIPEPSCEFLIELYLFSPKYVF